MTRCLYGVNGDATKSMIMKVMGGQNGKALVFSVLDKFVTEGSTEGLQELVANAFQKDGYKPDQDLLQGVAESILVGAVRPWKGVMPGSDPVEVGEQRMKRHQIIKEEG